MMSLEIVILDPDQRTLDKLAIASQARGLITLQKVDRVLYTHPPSGLDAIFLVVPAAEKWGAKPVPGAQILKTSPEDQRNGMPPYVVAGGVLRPDNPRDPVQDTKMVIGTVLDAIRHFNVSNKGGEICRLGFWAVNLLKGVSPEQLSTIFAEAL